MLNKLSKELQSFIRLHIEPKYLAPEHAWRSMAHGVVMLKAPKKFKAKWIAELENITDQWERDNGIHISHWEFEQFQNKPIEN